MCGGQRSTLGSWFSPSAVGSRAHIQVIRLLWQCFHPWRAHTGPRNVVLKLENVPGQIGVERDR